MIGAGLFGRVVAVEIGPEGGPGVRLADLRCTFKVEHKAAKSSGKATVKLYNAAPTTVALLHLPLAAIRVLAGYGIPQAIFQGNPIKDGVNLRVEGPDRILEVDAADGGRAYTSTFLQIALATPTTFGQVLALILAQTLWSRGFIDPTIEAVPLPHGIVLFGSPAAMLDRLAAAALPLQADWFIRDNAVYIVGKGQPTPEVALLISSKQGNLVGSPVATKDGVKLKALIDATMRPGRTFVLESNSINGAFIAKDVTFTGDSGWDNDFYMEITAKPPGVP